MACAAWAVGEAGVDLVDATVEWETIVEAHRDLVLHDSLCPMTPPAFIAECVQRARDTGRPVVGVRPVTDTVKVVAGDGRHERFKSTQHFDGPYHRQQHGLTAKDVERG